MKAAISSPTLKKVIGGDLCSGCGLCAGVSGGAVTIEESARGYNRPFQHAELSAEAERRVHHCCPGSAVAKWPTGPETDPYWGPCRSISTGHAADPELRFAASSGGMISALLSHALESGLVEEVVQIRADPDDPTRTTVARSRTAADVAASAGSRYSPSSPLEHVEELLDDGRRYAFIGKPCDVSALRRLGEIDPRVAERIPIMLSFFCGGIPSHSGTQQILDDLGVHKGELADFRYRGDGWPGYATAIRADGSAERMSYADSWGGRLSKHVQFRCKICPDAIGGVADIACADAWFGDESGYPLFEETDGRSLVIARSEAGSALLADAAASGRVVLEPAALDDIALMQPSQARRKRLILSRVAALGATLQPRPDFSGVATVAAARRAGIGETVKSFLGMARRIVMRRR
jgi:coenzyme F420 hydrogenase subunit beta